MKYEINGLDASGTRRVYGFGKTRQQALNNCIDAARDYLKSRPDIKALYLADDYGKPVFNAGTYSQWEIKRL